MGESSIAMFEHTHTPDAKNTGLFRPLHTATMDSAPAQLSMNPTMCRKGGWGTWKLVEVGGKIISYALAKKGR